MNLVTDLLTQRLWRVRRFIAAFYNLANGFFRIQPRGATRTLRNSSTDFLRSLLRGAIIQKLAAQTLYFFGAAPRVIFMRHYLSSISGCPKPSPCSPAT